MEQKPKNPYLEDLDGYRRALEDLYSGDVCFHCVLRDLISSSVAIIYDAMGGKRAKKMSKKWKEIERECDRVASHFIDLVDLVEVGRKKR